MKRIPPYCILFLLLLLAGCKTYEAKDQDHLAGLYYGNRLEEAAGVSAAMSEAVREADDPNALLWHLEAGSINLDAGNLETAYECLSRAERLLYIFDNEDQIRYHRPAMNGYYGYHSDRVLLHTLKALYFLASERFEDMLVEIRRLRFGQFNYLLNDSDRNIRQYDAANAGKEVSPWRMRQLLQSETLKQVYDSSGVAPQFQEFSRRRRPALSILFNPLAFYLSTMGYYFDNDYEEARIDLEYLRKIDPANPLYLRDIATMYRLLGDPVPEELKKIEPWPYDPGDQVIYVIFAQGEPSGWEQRTATVRLPGLVPAHWSFSIPAQTPFKGGNLQILANGKRYGTTPLADLSDILREEYWQYSFPDFAGQLHSAAASMTAAHRTAQANLAVQLASADDDFKTFRIAAAQAAVAATSETSVKQLEWRRWRTIPRHYGVVHFPIPADRKIRIEAPNARWDISIDNDVNRAVYYIREINGKCLLKRYESTE